MGDGGSSFANAAVEDAEGDKKEYFIQIIDISDKMLYNDAMAEQ